MTTEQVKIQDRITADTIYKVSYKSADDGDDGTDEEPRFITAYWSIRGLGSPIRMMLNAAQVNHWVCLYDVVEDGPNGWSRESWFKDKKWIKEYNIFANLPFLIDCRNNVVLVHTNTILTYLGNELNMMAGPDPILKYRCQELLCETMDFRDTMTQFAYVQRFAEAKEDAEVLLQGKASMIMDKLEWYLEGKYSGAKDGDLSTVCHLMGDSFSPPDFPLWEMIDQYIDLCKHYGLPLVTEKRPFLGAFWKNFANLPENKPYMECRLKCGLPFNNTHARFGSDCETRGPFDRTKGNAFWRKQGVVKVVRTKIQPTK